MKIENIVVGRLEANCYLITKDNKTIVVDPGDEYDKIKNALHNKNVVAIFITHYHPDHIGALDQLLTDFNVPVNPGNISGFTYKTLPTPGHKKDCITFYFKEEKVMFTGDFIFANDIGRWDLPTGNKEEMIESLKMISRYPDDIKIYPGHYEDTTLGVEKKHFKKYLEE